MARRVTQQVVEALGQGGVTRCELLWVDALVRLDSPVRLTQIVVELLRTPEASSLFFPVTMIVNG